MYKYKLTEEISRWSFEIKIKNTKNYWIAFTNPTAGPWKTIISFNKDNLKGEVYRFERNEKRPDLIIVNDLLKAVIIFEAKDNLNKLQNKNQLIKSCNVTNDIVKKLSKIKNDNYWEDRYTYNYYNGLLWGAEKDTKKDLVDEVFKNYSKYLEVNKNNQIAVEVVKSDNEKLKLRIFKSSNDETLNSIFNDFKN
jgi:hypothetical protein